MKKQLVFASLILATTVSLAHVPNFDPNIRNTPIIADLNILKETKVPVLYADETTKIGYTIASANMLNKISALAHQKGRCANFEVLDQIPQNLNSITKIMSEIIEIKQKDAVYTFLRNPVELQENAEITAALTQLKADNIKTVVEWLSSFPNRYNKANFPNEAIYAFQTKLTELTQNSKLPIKIDLIDHNKTRQKSVRLTITGATRPEEIVVLGGHIDSINAGNGFMPNPSAKAPGADDNASGSASLYEALRVLLATEKQPERTIEFIWYAGEESGLFGSAEIAESYKIQNKKVVAALQLDMTSFAGDGENNITSMTDFTTAWLRDYLKSMNSTYLKININEDECGYGCSDHASWYRRGYPAVFPTESKFKSSFQGIHTTKDVVGPHSNFNHSLIFAKIALIMAMDLGNSNLPN